MYEDQLRREGGETLASERKFAIEIGRTILSGRIDRVERRATGDGSVVVVVDFKTGSETSYTYASQLVANPQLAAYQLALAEGAIEGLDAAAVEGLAAGGAQLLILTPDDKPVRAQPPLDADGFADWRETFETAGEGMAGATFYASVDTHCTGYGQHGLCPIHIVAAVTQ